MRAVLLVALVVLAACDGPVVTDGGVDGGADAGTETVRREPEPPVWACPEGWGAVDLGGVTVCDPGVSEACEAGQAHVVGEAGCAPVGGACPSGDFADDLPSDGVRFVRPGGSGDGSRAAPFGSIAEALSGAGVGTVIALAKGVYDERITARSGVHVRGACAAETVLRGGGTEGSVIDVQPSITGAAVSGLSIRPSGQVGVFVVGELALRGVAIEGAELFGVLVGGGELDAEDLLVRGTELGPASDSGVGVVVSEASASLRRVVLEDNHQAGLLLLADAAVTVEDLAARRQRVGAVPDVASGLVVDGGQLTGTRVLVEDTRSAGVVASVGGEIRLEDAVVRGCRAEGERIGFGVASQSGAVTLARAWITDAQGTGLQTSEGGTAALTDVVIDAVVPPPGRPGWAVGLSVAEEGTMDVSRVWLAGTAAAAISVLGQEGASVAHITGSDVSIREVADLGISGVGLYLAIGAEADLERVAIERTSHAGIVVNGSTLRLSDARVTDTTFNLDDGLWGRGLEALDSEVTVERARFEGQHEAAVLLSRSQVVLSDIEIAGVGERGCADDACADAPGGTGLSVVDGTQATVRGFSIEDAPLCGVQVARLGELDLFDGVIRQAAVGACVQVDDYDLARLANDVRYESTGTSIQATAHHVPEVNDPIP